MDPEPAQPLTAYTCLPLLLQQSTPKPRCETCMNRRAMQRCNDATMHRRATCNAASRRPAPCLEPALLGGVEGFALTTGLQCEPSSYRRTALCARVTCACGARGSQRRMYIVTAFVDSSHALNRPVAEYRVHEHRPAPSPVHRARDRLRRHKPRRRR
jgi:hypothetical protein